jgi:hypothetical protein
MVSDDGSEVAGMVLVLHEGIDSMRGRYHLETVSPQDDFQLLPEGGIVLHTQDAEKGIIQGRHQKSSPSKT